MDKNVIFDRLNFVESKDETSFNINSINPKIRLSYVESVISTFLLVKDRIENESGKKYEDLTEDDNFSELTDEILKAI